MHMKLHRHNNNNTIGGVHLPIKTLANNSTQIDQKRSDSWQRWSTCKRTLDLRIPSTGHKTDRGHATRVMQR